MLRPRLAVVALAALVAAPAAAPAAPATAPRPHPGAAVRVDHRPADDAPAVGRRDAPVTAELFFTPGAPNAHEAYRTVLELQRRHPTRLRVVFRPLTRNQTTPAITLAAHQRGRFFELMAVLAVGAGAPSAAATLELAVKVGLTRTVAERAHLDDTIGATLEANRHRAFRLGTTSNPELVLNGQPIGRRVHAATATVGDLEREYQAAYDEARRAQAEGLPRRALVAWGAQREACGDDPDDDDEATALEAGGFDRGPAVAAPEPAHVAWHVGRLIARGTGCPAAPHLAATLDESTAGTTPHHDGTPLVAAPLPTAGLPTFGPGDAPVPIFVVCNLRSRFCLDQLDLARRVAEHHPGDVRVVWVPWIDLALDGADRDLTLAQAALCATAAGDGWGFVRAITTAGIPARGRLDVAALAAAAGLDVDGLVTCAAGEPLAARAAVVAARAAGLDWSPTVVIGGRAYLGGFSDDRRASERVAAELAPGLLEALVPSW